MMIAQDTQFSCTLKLPMIMRVQLFIRFLGGSEGGLGNPVLSGDVQVCKK